MLAISNVEVQDDQIKGDSSQVLHPESHDVIVKVDKSGTFVFPVSFKIFEKYLNKAVLFDQIAKSREKCMELLVDDNYRLLTLRKFYNLFYMFPETESRAHFFKDLPGIPLSTLVKLGQPQDEKAYNTVAEYAAKKSLEDNSIVSFKVFQKNILNLSDIVEEMKQLDNNYLSKDFRECALDYYLAFYITPEIREMYAYKLRSNTNAMKTRLLAILNEEVADELRKNLRQLANPSPALKLRRSKTPEKSTGEDKSAGDNQLKSKTSEESVKVPAIPSIEIADEIGQIMPQLPISSPGLKLRKPKTPKKTATEDKSVKDNHLKSLSTEESLQVPTIPSIPMADEIGQMLPQLPIFSPGRRLRRSKTPEKTGAEDKSVNLVKSLTTEESIQVPTIPSIQVAYEIGQILPQLSTPQPALRLRRSKTPERSEHQSESGKENKMKTIESLPFETDVQINIGKRGRFIFPVSFKTFRSYINYKDIIRPILMKELTQNEAELADLIADPSNPQCKKVFLQYYYKFYARHDVRQRYAYKFNCPDPKMLAKILEPAKPLDEKAMQTVSRTTAPQVEGKSPNKTKDQVASTLEKPAKESPSNPISFEIFKSRVTVTVTDTTYMDNKTVDNAKESELIPECENKVTGKTEICTNKKPREKSGLNPITFEMFKRRVSNMDEIVNKMLLCDEYKGKSKEMVFYDYYEGFYSGPEMREKFECRFKPCPSKKLQILLSFPPNNEKECRKETDCQVCTSNELCEVGQQELAIPRSIEKNTEDVAKESEQITEHQAKVTTEPGAFQNQSHTEPQAMPNAASSKAATVPDLESQGPIERSELQNKQTVAKSASISDICNAERIAELARKRKIDVEPISDISGEVGNVLTETVLISSSADSGSESSQLEKTNFVDVMGVAQASQVPQMAWDPLISEDPGDLLPVVKSTELVSVKRESIALPTNLRVICESDDCQWEDITPEDQIIDLDASQNEGSTLSCFDIPNSKNQDSEEMVELLLSNTNLSEDDGPVGNVIELEASAAKELVINAPTPAFNIPVNPTKRRAPSPGLKCKRYKLMNDKVPQLRHEFQSLPMGVMVRLESGQENNTDSPNTMAIQPVKPTNMPTPEPAETHITPSQDFAVGNELLDCTELKGLLDSTNVNTRKRFPSTAQNYLLRA
ncbi:protein telomere ends associated isoform X5 [Drosophila eugracilis]|uniref:protein telomere ends associated isoform X5 n=1 Tax=Drosophila eugracilis TaxID=29029 RepID=UPI0007E600FA|nr:protein telomere ends associated isoform X5 [Drosophila eugracilis]